MPIRKAISADLRPSARIYAAAFKNEALFGQHLHPYREQYPDDMYLFFLRGNRTAFYSGPDEHFLVSYLTVPGDDRTESRITGWASWTRKRRIAKKPSIFRRVLQAIVKAYNHIEAFFYPNRALEASRMSVMPELGRLTNTLFVGDREESWTLNTLAVDPTVQKTGHGRQLVAWGLERAKEEGISANVVSSEGNERFYRTCGFDVELGRVGDIEVADNPFKDIAGGMILVRDKPKL